mgnify:CR=1 FL=1
MAFEPSSVLVVDDEPQICALLKEEFAGEGIVKEPQQALAARRREALKTLEDLVDAVLRCMASVHAQMRKLLGQGLLFGVGGHGRMLKGVALNGFLGGGLHCVFDSASVCHQEDQRALAVFDVVDDVVVATVFPLVVEVFG